MKLDPLIASHVDGYTLPAPFYLSEEIYEQDVARIFSRYWIYVGVESEIAEAGDFFTVEIGKDSIIIVRDDEMGINAFHNVCRHRGARLRSAGSGIVGNLVCPYHSWTYNLCGELIHNEHMGENFDRSKFNLKSVHLKSMGGLLFICLADNPPEDFEVMRKALEPYIAPHQIANTKVAFQADIIEEGNWKLTMENNRECNHCSANHPELTVPLMEYGFGYQPTPQNIGKMREFDDLLASEHKRWESCGLPSVTLDALSATTGYRTVRLPIAQHGESQTIDTKVACTKLLGDLTDRKLGGLSLWTQPNSWHHFMSDHIVTFCVLPIAAGKTLLRTKWLVHKDAREGIDYDVEKMASVWTATNAQDSALVERTQLGVSSPAYQPGPYSPYTEGLVDVFCKWYLKHLAA